MKRRQGKKLDALANAIGDNMAGIAGELKEIDMVTQLYGFPFCGYLAKVEVPRPGGVLDEIIIAFTGEAAAETGQSDIDFIRRKIVGKKVIAYGKVQALKNLWTGRVLVFILAEFIRMAQYPMPQDDVMLRGIIANDPVYRETPRGKRITNITVETENVLMKSKCFIPCICWQDQADEAAGWAKGDTVELLGRYQSRQYEKIIDARSGSRELRITHEISVQLVSRKGRQEMKSKETGGNG